MDGERPASGTVAAFAPPAAPAARRAYRMTAFVVWFLVVFLVLFPKGGVKVGTTPLTWGYLFIGLILAPLTLVRVLAFPLRTRRGTLLAVASLLPFQVLVYYSYKAYGLNVDLGGIAAVVVAFFVLPFLFLVVFPPFLPRVDAVRLAALLRFCILAAALIGIFLFFYYPITGDLPQIPYLTVNAGDYGDIINTKHIARGAFLKLIATYNNGNLYGVATLILLPMYDKLEPKRWKKLSVRAALILTLSRTVWAGLIAEQLLSLVPLGLEILRTFPRVRAGAAARRLLLVLVTAGAVFSALVFNSATLDFLFDRDLGGRASYFSESAKHITLLPSVPYGGFLEVVYATALEDYGVLGLLTFLLIFVLPLVFLAVNRRVAESPLRSAAAKGLILYAIVAGVDGGLVLIPIMAFYWFAYMIMLEGWPGGLDLQPGTVQAVWVRVLDAPAQSLRQPSGVGANGTTLQPEALTKLAV